MANQPDVRVAMIGVGGIAVSHLTNLLRMPEVQLVALVDLDPARAQAYLRRAAANLSPAADIPVVPAFTDAGAMLRAERPGAVFVCVPPDAHGEIELACAEAGAHLLVEKPLGLDLGRVRRIRRALDARGLIAAVGYQVRYADSLDAARRMLGDRPLGMVIGTYLGGLPRTPWWRVRRSSGGQVVEQATHVVDLMRYVAGEVDAVYASAATRLLGDEPGLDIADVSAATFTFASGAAGSLVNTCALDGVPGEPWDHGVTVIAARLSVRAWIGSARVATPGHEEIIFNRRDPSYELDAAFIRAVARGDPSGIRSSYADAMETLRLTLAIEESARRHAPVRPDEL